MLKLSCSAAMHAVCWASVLASPAVIPYRGLTSFTKGRCTSFIRVHPSSGCNSRKMMPQPWWCILISRHEACKRILTQIFFFFPFSSIGTSELLSAALQHTAAAFHRESPGFVVASALRPETNLVLSLHLRIAVGPKLNHSTAFSQNGQRTLGRRRSIPMISFTSLAFKTEFSGVQAMLFVYSSIL